LRIAEPRQPTLDSRMSIITKRGDDGKTDLLFGRRIEKTDLRVEALGAVDELNSSLGVARAAGLEPEMEEVIDRVQESLIGLMGRLACLAEDLDQYAERGYAQLTEDDLAWLEAQSKDFENRGVRLNGWARPGAEHSLARASLDVARAVARRAERRLWQLEAAGEPLAKTILLYLNRISDLLWILARVEPTTPR
jgi:cob(I)alamin adenosyltransferase